jgi:hypothetical protein
MRLSENAPPQTNPVDAARVAIWRLFQEGYVDEDMATAGLLAVDLGTRRARRNTMEAGGPREVKSRGARKGCSGDHAA